MSHDFHDALPGYDPAQVLVAGCKECEMRSRDVHLALTMMDDSRFRRACERAKTWWDGVSPITVSEPEARVFRVLGPIVSRLERIQTSSFR